MNRTIFIKYLIVQLFLNFNIVAFAQQYGTDNILNFYTVEQSIYIPYGQKAIYQDFDTRMEIDVDSASFVSPAYFSLFAFDKNGIYYKGKLVDPDTTGFRFLSTSWRNGEVYIWKNNKHVYVGNSILNDIDAPTCVGVVNDVLRDKNGQYENFNKITDKQKNKELLREYPQGSEGLSYEYMTKYIVSTLSILNQRKELEGIDPKSF